MFKNWSCEFCCWICNLELFCAIAKSSLGRWKYIKSVINWTSKSIWWFLHGRFQNNLGRWRSRIGEKWMKSYMINIAKLSASGSRNSRKWCILCLKGIPEELLRLKLAIPLTVSLLHSLVVLSSFSVFKIMISVKISL